MNAQPNESASWSRARWTLTILTVFGVQFVALLLLSAPPDARLRPDESSFPRITALLDEYSSEQLLAATRHEDPTVMALPHAMNFSSRVWNDGVKTAIEPLAWKSEPSFLDPDFGVFGQSFSATTSSSAAPGEFSSERRMPTVRSQSQPTTKTIASGTRVYPAANLRRLGFADLPAAPSMQTDETLRDTIVEVVVDRSGRVYSCRLGGRIERSAASPESQRQANAAALAHARKIRFNIPRRDTSFESLEPVSFVSGQIRYKWGYKSEKPPAAANK